MSIQNLELIDDASALNAENARELTRKIRVGLEGTYALIIDAFKGRAWTALGYPTWDAYCQGEFGALSLQPPREERQQVILSLREAGMSVRAIGSATDISHMTVVRDLRALEASESPLSGVTNVTPEASTIGLDGKTYTQKPEPAFYDVMLDDSLLDMSADDMGIAIKTGPQTPRVMHKPAGILIPAEVKAEKLAQQGELFTAEELVKVSRTITVSSSVLANAKLDLDAISDQDREVVLGNLQDAVDRLNGLLDRLVNG